MKILEGLSKLYHLAFPWKKREQESKARLSALEEELLKEKKKSDQIRKQAQEKESRIQDYERKSVQYAAGREENKRQEERKMENAMVVRNNQSLDASVEEARVAANYHLQRFDGIKQDGQRGDAKFVAIYSMLKYLETFEGEVRTSIASDQFRELGQQNEGVVQAAQSLSSSVQAQDARKYISGVAGLVAQAVDTAGTAIKAEAIKKGDYEAYRRQVPDEAVLLIKQGLAGVLGNGNSKK
ncbi:hypothetical protein HYU13_04300 [Candidatus Woesearchaeota archaeon]|nr:hypothetical protein [Candidatus Woesearchaeota archaeon]